jgi:hypothetical protein
VKSIILLSHSTMENLLVSPESNQEITIALVRALDKRVVSRSERIFPIIETFQNIQVLQQNWQGDVDRNRKDMS